MPFSAFAPFGLNPFSGEVPIAETIYKTIAVACGPAFDTAEGTDIEAWNFSDAIALASARVSLERAQRNLDPATAYEKIPQHEAAFVVSPPTSATPAQRRAVLAAKNLAAKGSRPEAIENALIALLGSDFVALYVMPTGSPVMWPVVAGAAPALFSRVDIPAKTIKITTPVAPDFSVSGVATVPYENWDTSQADELVSVADKLLIEGEIPGGSEIVSVTAVAGTGTSRTFTATFTKPHALDCSATTRQTPFQMSMRRHMLVILKNAAALNIETRRKVNDIMRSMVRGVSTWSIVREYVDGYGGFFVHQLDVDALDANLLAAFFR